MRELWWTAHFWRTHRYDNPPWGPAFLTLDMRSLGLTVVGLVAVVGLYRRHRLGLYLSITAMSLSSVLLACTVEVFGGNCDRWAEQSLLALAVAVFLVLKRNDLSFTHRAAPGQLQITQEISEARRDWLPLLSALLMYDALSALGPMTSTIALRGSLWNAWSYMWSRAQDGHSLFQFSQIAVRYTCWLFGGVLVIIGLIWIWFRPVAFRWIAVTLFLLRVVPTVMHAAYLLFDWIQAGRQRSVYRLAFDSSLTIEKLLIPSALTLFALRYLPKHNG